MLLAVHRRVSAFDVVAGNVCAGKMQAYPAMDTHHTVLEMLLALRQASAALRL